MTEPNKTILLNAVNRYKEIAGVLPSTIRHHPSIEVDRDLFQGIRIIVDPNLSAGSIRLVPNIPPSVLAEVRKREATEGISMQVQS